MKRLNAYIHISHDSNLQWFTLEEKSRYEYNAYGCFDTQTRLESDSAKIRELGRPYKQLWTFTTENDNSLNQSMVNPGLEQFEKDSVDLLNSHACLPKNNAYS